MNPLEYYIIHDIYSFYDKQINVWEHDMTMIDMKHKYDKNQSGKFEGH